MATETIYKLQPERTMYLRGFDRRGAAASLHTVSSTGFKTSGVFRDFADFAVPVLWDADDGIPFNHLLIRPLPNFDFTDMVLTFDLDYNDQLQPIDSPFDPWIDWEGLSYIKANGDTGKIKLWDYAALQVGTFTVASVTWTLTEGGSGIAQNDRLTFFYLDIPFDYEVTARRANFDMFAQGAGYDHYVKVAGLNLSITAATNASPIQVTTSVAHGLTTGQEVRVSHCLGNTAANGFWVVTVVDTTNFTLDTSTGNGAYTGSGTCGRRRKYSYIEVGGDSSREAANGTVAAVTGDPWVTASNYLGGAIIGATNATPIVITTTNPHGLSTGNSVDISGVGGNTAANGQFIITRISDTQFSLDGSVGNGAYTSGGTVNKTNRVMLTASGTDGTEIVCSGSDGAGDATIFNNGLTSALNSFINQINQYNWPSEAPNMAIMAENPTGNDLKIKAARWGTVNTSGTAVTWVTGNKFTAIAASSKIYIDGVQYTVSSVTSATVLVLTATAGTQTGKRYLAERGGDCGNFINIQCRAKNTNFTTSGDVAFGAYRQNNKILASGSSDVTWRITIDFTARSIDSLRQCWLTLAPKMVYAAAYTNTDFTFDCTNWGVTDPSSKRALKIAGPGSVRVHSRDAWAVYTGSGWTLESGFYLLGFAKVSSTLDDKITIRYACRSTHKLFFGTSLYKDRGKVAVSIDGAAEVDMDTYLNTEPAAITRRQIGTSTYSSGVHIVVFRVKHEKHASSSDYKVYFDYLEATVESDVQDPIATYTNRSMAMDYGTNHGFGLPPARLAWMFERLGMKWENIYASVFWWNQRKRTAGNEQQYDVQMGGTWAAGDDCTITLSSIAVKKTLRPLDVDGGDATIARKVLAASLRDRINALFSSVWAEVVGAGLDTVRVHPRSTVFSFTKSAAKTSASGTITETGNLNLGSEGVWIIDETITPYLNNGAKKWFEDFFSVANSKTWVPVVALSMELLNPPEDPAGGKVWAARFNSGQQVLTATGFGTEAQAAITGATNATPIVITATGHGYRTGDTVTVAGVGGNTAANGDWLITVVSANTFNLDGSVGNGSYTSGGTVVRKLVTTHCAFVADVVDYQKKIYKEFADMMNTAGLTIWLQFGEFLWWFFSEKAIVVTAASNATPIVITAAAHGMNNGEGVIISGVKGNTAANGWWVVANKTTDTFELTGSVGNGAFTSSPDARARGRSMGYYDDDTKAAAVVALGRALVLFTTQNDDPTVNSSADANFLRGLIKTHIDTIRTHVLGTHAGAKFELLYADDVNHATMYQTLDLPFPQGGRLNRHVNLPTEYLTDSGSGLDRIKMEALSWGSFYRHLTKAKAAQKFSFTAPLSWPKSKTRILIPIFNGGCPWQAEYLHAIRLGTDFITFWAFDQFNLLSWTWPLPTPNRRAMIF